MKTILAMFMSSVLAAVAADEPKKQLFTANQLEFVSYGTVSYEDINGKGRGGIGYGADYFATRNLGIGLRAEQDNVSDEWVDRGIGRLTMRAPLWDRISPYGYAQGIWGVEANDWGAGAGAGLELRVAKYLSGIVEGGLDVSTKGKGGARFSAGLRLNF